MLHKVLRRAPRNELAQAFRIVESVQFLLGRVLTSAVDTALDRAQLRRTHVLIFIHVLMFSRLLSFQAMILTSALRLQR